MPQTNQPAVAGLALPLIGETNRPIFDANGKIVSIVEHAPAFTHAMNNHAELLAALKVARALTRDLPPDGIYHAALTRIDAAIAAAERAL